jgi:Na+/H+ antiporter NhaC
MRKDATSLFGKMKWIKSSLLLLILFLGQIAQDHWLTNKSGVTMAFPPLLLIGIVLVGAAAGAAGKGIKKKGERQVGVIEQRTEMYKNALGVIREREQRKTQLQEQEHKKLITVIILVVVVFIVVTIIYVKLKRNKK